MAGFIASMLVFIKTRSLRFASLRSLTHLLLHHLEDAALIFEFSSWGAHEVQGVGEARSTELRNSLNVGGEEPELALNWIG